MASTILFVFCNCPVSDCRTSFHVFSHSHRNDSFRMNNFIARLNTNTLNFSFGVGDM